MNDLDQIHLYPEEMEYTSDSCSFFYNYIDKQIYKLKIIGYLDETTVRKIFIIGNRIDRSFHRNNPDKVLYFTIDLNQVRGMSLKANKMFSRYESFDNQYIVIHNVSSALKSYLTLFTVYKNKKRNIVFKEDETDALKHIFQQIGKTVPKNQEQSKDIQQSNKSSKAIFDELWIEKKETIKIGEQQYRKVTKDEWKYTSRDNRFHVTISVIETNILLIYLSGFAYPVDIDSTYEILGEIINTLKFDDKENKIYSINDLRELKGITRKARKKTTLYEVKFQKYSHILISIPSPLARFLIKMLKKLYPKQYRLWVIMENLEKAFNFLKKYHSQNLSIEKKQFETSHKTEDKLQIPESKKELKALVKKQHKMLQNEKKEKEEQLEKLQEITGNISFDESFEQFIDSEIEKSENTMFADVMKMIKLLQDDFHEVMRERDYQTRLMRESEEKYRSVVDLASDIIAMVQDGNIILVNKAAQQITSYQKRELLYYPFHKFLNHGDAFYWLYKKFLTSDKNNANLETYFISKENKHIPVSMSVGKITYQRRPAVMIIASDITERKQREAQLDQYRKNLENLVEERTHDLLKAKEKAEESDKLKSAFLANMSHEIRTPMNAIIGFSSLLDSGNITPEEKEMYINLIKSNGQDLLRLVDDIINLAKIEAGEQEKNQQAFDLRKMLEGLISDFEAIKVKEEKLDLNFQLDYNLDEDTLFSDPGKIKQIIRNLLNNAFKFTDSGYIKISAQQDADKVYIFVKDTGLGLNQDEKEIVFDRFRKSTTGNDKIYGGTGLGLSISQGLAYVLDGDLYLESSEKGKGSVFAFEFPYVLHGTTESANSKERESAQGSHQKEESRENKYPDWSNRKILIVEDNEANAKFIKAALSSTGVEMEFKEKGQEAIDYFKKHNDLDAVLLDIRLPYMTGYEVVDKMKKINERIPVVAQTAYAMKDDKKQALKSGFNDYVAKPMNPDNLVNVINQHISSLEASVG